MVEYEDYVSGYIKRNSEGQYLGTIKIEGIDLSPIVGVMFKQKQKTYLWLRRVDALVYDSATMRYNKRKREPQWEAYLEKQVQNNTTVFKGEFSFMCFKFSIVGMWDVVMGRDSQRMNFFVERLPMEKQDIIQGIINKKDEKRTRDT